MKPILSFLFLIFFFLLIPTSKAELAEESCEMVSVTWQAGCSSGSAGMCEEHVEDFKAGLIQNCGGITLFQVNYE